MAFVSNFIWEPWHASYLYASHAFNLSFWPLMIYAAGVDALLLLVIFFGGALLWKNWRWFLRADVARQNFYVVIAGVVIALIVEVKAVYIFQQWTYSNFMPTVFGIGVSPLAQLALTGLLSLSIARQAIKMDNKIKQNSLI
ncbi:hypothetical protein COU01_02220 [Candidatus Falkowbacteria bacterium CG10_big_fil_rev_8_21_14_0_10_44_15]|uniref:Uncharacterized protein n=1 Tax=Candidatus Falkowbacteria bacterium CG10_big_fil_rev_8_21_14_0_10_44_15 TaxID=1974569 RepID=A0A2H0V1P4_9BACT|nr:MAG: hypothetical protein COU01_02220 [Candidatus Falkowbacteria bacterium CG10_big_fil_rev_8_21_14_0_10_44_15]